MHLESGSHLGPYEIFSLIGAGGMGEVYRARDTRLGREVAVKVLPRELSADPERLARFEREARSSSALNHRNIVTVHDFGATEGDAWLVMELVRGQSLRDALAHGRLPLKRVLAIACGIADGLSAAHDAGLIHRDLKPENIMLADDGTPKILDFGLVKKSSIASSPDALTELRVSRTGLIAGTAAYMSPEQARGEQIDFRTDQFSFGLILYEMALGRHPFERASPVETLAAILNDDPPPLDETIPEPLVWIIERCLTKNPAQRYGSTTDLAYELRHLRDRGDRPVSVQKKTGARWPLAAALLAGTVVIAAALMMRPRTVTGPAMEFGIAPNIDEVSFGEIVPPVTLSPDGRYLVVVGAGGDGVERLWLHDLRSRATRPIAGSDHAFAVTFSPDSRQIAYAAEGKLQVIAVDGGPPTFLCATTPPGQVAWNGDTILFATTAGLYRVNSGGGPAREVISKVAVHADQLMWPQFLPDGKHFLYVADAHQNDDVINSLLVGSLDGGPSTRVEGVGSRAVYAHGNLLFVRDGTLLAQPFDLKTLRLTGGPQPLLDHLFYFRSTGLCAFSVSNDGLLVWRSGRLPSREVWVDRVGMEVGSVGTGIFSGGRISPDGSRFAAAVVDPKLGTSDLWIYDLNRENAERITFQPTEESNPVWSPDGRTLFYRCDKFGPPDIFQWNLGEDHGTLLYHGVALQQPEDVAPDGKSLLFDSFSRVVGSRGILVLPLEPRGQPRRFTSTPFNELSPRFSPDGQWIAYQSDASGRPEIYVRPFRGAGLATRVSRDGGTKPRWRRDGKELLFLAPGGRLMSVAVTAGVPGSLPRMLFQASDAVDFEPAADGSRFLMQIEQATHDTPIHALINWPSRLTAQN